MSPNDNRNLFRRYIEDIDPRGDGNALPEYIHADIILPADATPHGRQGIEGLREHHEFLHQKVKYRSTVEDMVAEGDKVAARVTVRGKLISEFMGLPASGKEFTVAEFMIAQFREGKISQVWRVVDLMSLVQQLQRDSGSPAK